MQKAAQITDARGGHARACLALAGVHAFFSRLTLKSRMSRRRAEVDMMAGLDRGKSCEDSNVKDVTRSGDVCTVLYVLAPNAG